MGVVEKMLLRCVILGATCALVANVGILTSQAKQVIKDSSSSVDAQLKTDVIGTSASEGQIFEAELPDDLQYKKWFLPKGTVFRGQVTKVRPSKCLGRPGYVVLNVDEAELPDGMRFDFDEQQYKPRNAKTHEKNALTLKQSVLTQLPTSAIGMGLTLPLSITGAASGWAMVPAGFGARMLAGSTFAMSKKSKYSNQPVPSRLANGALDGSGVVRLLGFVGKYPEPEYKSGDTVKLFFNPKGLHELFVASASHKFDNAVPLEPTGPVVAPPQQMEEPPNVVKTPGKEPQTATFP
jgi:hypothetical protein